MALQEELESQGNFLFRWRTYIPSIILLFSIFYINNLKYKEYYETLPYLIGCYFLSLFGLFIRCFTIGFTPANTSGRNTKKQVADTVNSKGIYSLIRHPLYVGNFFMFMGVVLILRSISFLFIFILFYWLYYERIMFAEEQFLRKKFGNNYTEWAEKTPAILPKFQNYIQPELPFSIKNIIKREYPSLFGITLIFLIYDLLRVYLSEPEKADSIYTLMYPHHIYVLLVSICFYIVIRILSKYTELFSVEGR